MIGSRQKKGNPKNDEFYTPKFIFDALGCQFNMDVASPLDHTTNVPADLKLTPKEDGLQSDWCGFVRMNPPFSKSEPWVDKFLNHNNGIALLPMSKAKWFSRVWLKADGILLLPSNLKFDKPDNLRSDIFMPVILAAMGLQGRQALIKSNLGKVR